MPNFDVRDAHGSIITIESSVVGGANRQIVTAAISTENSSVMLLNGANVIGSVATLQGTNPWRTLGSVSGEVTVASTIAIGNTPSISGTVNIGTIPGSVISFQGGTRISSVINSAPSSLLTGSSIFGMLPAGTQMLGSVAAIQGNAIWNIAGSVTAQQLGTRTTSIVGSIPSSTLVGTYGHRNDNVASFLGGNLSWNPIGTDSAGRTLMRPFAPEEARVEGYISLTSTSMTTLVAAAGAGLRNYITDVWVANTGAAATLVTFSSGGGASVLGYTIAPAGSGSNLPGLTTPIRTLANETFGVQAGTATSTLYVTVKGFKAP